MQLEGQEIKKTKTAKGDRAPARRGVGFRQTVHAGAAHPRPSPDEARRGERASACGLLLLLLTLDLRKWR
jgi:hypothetical protein